MTFHVCDFSLPKSHIFLVNSAIFQVALRRKSNDELLCGGAIVNEEWVLTSAKCLQETIAWVLSLHSNRAVINQDICKLNFKYIRFKLTDAVTVIKK